MTEPQYWVYRDGRGRFLLQSQETGCIHGLMFCGFPGESAHAFSREYGSVSYLDGILNLADIPELADVPFFTLEGLWDLSSYFHDGRCQEIWSLLGTLAKQNGCYCPPPNGQFVATEGLLWQHRLVNPKGSWNLSIVGSWVTAQGIWLATWDGQIFVVDHHGEEIQRYALPMAARCVVATHQQADPYVSCEDGYLYEFTAKMPQPCHRLRPADDAHYSYLVWSMVAIADGLFIADGYGNLWHLDANFEVKWQCHDRDYWLGWWLAADEEQVYWGHYHGVTVVDRHTGKERWWQPLAAPVLCGSLVGDELVVGCSDRRLYCLSKHADPKTREPSIRSVYTCTGLPYTMAITPDQQFLWLGDYTGQLEKLQIKTDADYQQMTRLQVNSGSITCLNLWGDRLYVGTNQGILCAIKNRE